MNENTATMTTTWEQPPDLSDAEMEDVVETRKYLIFVSDGLRLGVEANMVVEILNNQQITYLPMMPDFVRGIINLRGQIIPILDIRARMGKPEQENELVVVLNFNGSQMGILVDAVDQMTDIPVDDILPVPTHSNQELVSGMCSLPDESGTMMVLDCEQLMRHE
jgi:purine-binding chemotaxis protein CheW